MALPNNNEIIFALNAGNAPVFQEIYDHYSPAIFRNIFRLLPHQQEAEDLLQTVFVQLWENRSRLTGNQSVAGWLFTTSFYMTMGRIRKMARLQLRQLEENMLDMAETDETEHNTEIYLHKVRLLDKAINLLPARKKQAFELCKMEGKSYKEAAAVLNVSEDTVREYVKSAMSILRRYALQADISMYMLLAWIMC
ncbi:MAG: RNA polymerase sigma factor [Pseudobacter sp.]|uniref:RNA polymerase sigma factor n=1 Tax=Pseudobacter sp. TaxID=2045420 RepID=UPI003F81E9CF